jgi:hypothetical protein
MPDGVLAEAKPCSDLTVTPPLREQHRHLHFPLRQLVLRARSLSGIAKCEGTVRSGYNNKRDWFYVTAVLCQQTGSYVNRLSVNVSLPGHRGAPAAGRFTWRFVQLPQGDDNGAHRIKQCRGTTGVAEKLSERGVPMEQNAFQREGGNAVGERLKGVGMPVAARRKSPQGARCRCARG